MKHFREDVTCSTCPAVLKDPVSIECGHNFCRKCISTHWSGVLPWSHRCPKCQAPCTRKRMVPDTRLKSLVEKIRKLELACSIGGMKHFREDVTCSICLDVLEDPVSIECGHNFCRKCISAHCSGVSALDSQCPECRHPYCRERMVPDTRLKSLVEKIRKLELILNIGCRVKDPDLEYLEMFLQVAEEVGKEYEMEPIQHLDLLVRDWSSSLALGAEGGEKHLGDVRQRLAATSPCKHPKALAVLGRSSSCCYLMPYPGKQIATGSTGALRDMDADFRENLRDYVTALVGSAGRHVRRDQQGKPLTGTQLAAKIKNLSEVMRTHRSGFSSPCQMAIAFHNQKAMDSAHKALHVFLTEKYTMSQHKACLRVTPSTIQQQLEEQLSSVLRLCQEKMKQPEKALLTALEAKLTQEAETFLATYSERYQNHAIQMGTVVGGVVLMPVGGMIGAAVTKGTGITIAKVGAVLLGGGTGAYGGRKLGKKFGQWQTQRAKAAHR